MSFTSINSKYFIIMLFFAAISCDNQPKDDKEIRPIGEIKLELEFLDGSEDYNITAHINAFPLSVKLYSDAPGATEPGDNPLDVWESGQLEFLDSDRNITTFRADSASSITAYFSDTGSINTSDLIFEIRIYWDNKLKAKETVTIPKEGDATVYTWNFNDGFVIK